MSKKYQELVASIDIGSSNILVLIADKNQSRIKIIGSGSTKSKGIKKGVVVNIQTAVEVIKKAISEAENMAGYSLSSITSGISGTGLRGLNSNGRISINYDVVDDNDVMRVLQSAEAITLPATQDIIHATPRSYKIDSTTEADDPVGMHGDILEAEVHIITHEKSCIKNISQSIYQCGVEVENTIPNIIATSQGILTQDEKTLGACVIDIGGGTTDIAIFDGGSIGYTSVIAISAHEVTTDIMQAFSTNQSISESLKKDYGYALAGLIKEEELIDVKQIGDSQIKKLSSRTLAEVIEARYEEIFNEIKQVLFKAGLDQKITSIVLTGGGAKISGCAHLAESIFNKPSRIGEIKQIEAGDNLGNDPSYSVVMGLLLSQETVLRKNNHPSWKPGVIGMVKKIFSSKF